MMAAVVAVRLWSIVYFLRSTLLVGAFVVPTRHAPRHTAAFVRGKKMDDDDMQALYKSVAAQDPDWFRSFVVDVLGENTVEPELLDLLERSGTLELEDSSTDLDVDDQTDTFNDTAEQTTDATRHRDNIDTEADYFFEIKRDGNESEDISGLETTNSEPSPGSERGRNDELDVLDPETESPTSRQQTMNSSTVAAGSGVMLSSPNAAEEPKEAEVSASGIPSVKSKSEGTNTVAPITAPMTVDPSIPVATTEPQQCVQFQLQDSSEPTVVPLARFASLGYGLDELLDLEADVLDMIAVDGISRPLRGIPDRWKTRKSTAKIVDKATASEQHQPAKVPSTKEETKMPNRPGSSTKRSMAETASSISEATDQRSVRSNDSILTDAAVGPETMQGSAKEAKDTESSLSSRWEAEDGLDSNPDTSRREEYRIPGEAPRRRRRRTRKSDVTNRTGKPMHTPRRRGQQPTYRGRRRNILDSNRPQKDDPPTRYWMGLDTFRSLLRAEFKLRELITFGQLEGPLLDEAEWRLDLYRKWLWTLHSGVGDPIVQSRNERAQREKDRLQRERRIEEQKRRR